MGREVGLNYCYLKDGELIIRDSFYICGRSEVTDTFVSFFNSQGNGVTDIALNNPNLVPDFKYIPFKTFKDQFAFKDLEKNHNKELAEIENNICNAKQEIESLRNYQTKSTTEIAFKMFDEKIQELNEYIYYQEERKNNEEYNKYILLEKYFEEAEKAIQKDPNLILIAYWSE